MRDAHRIREEGTVAQLLRAGLRLSRVGLLVGVAFWLGRVTAPMPMPDASTAAAPSAANATATQAAPAQPAAPTGPPETAAATPTADGAAATPAAPSKKGRERRPGILVASPAPDALPDGLLPAQVGTARAGQFTAQIAAFAAREEARAFCQQLVRRGFHPFVAHNGPSAARRHPVCIGRFDSRQDAADYRSRLAHADISAVVVQVD